MDPDAGEKRRGEGSRFGDDSMSSPASPNARPGMAGPGVGNKTTASPGMAGEDSQKKERASSSRDERRRGRGGPFWLLFVAVDKK